MQYVPSLGEFGKIVISCLEDGKQRCCSKYEDSSRGMNPVEFTGKMFSSAWENLFLSNSY